MAKKVKVITENIKPDSFLISIVNYLHNRIQYLNDSKIFAGCMIIILNIISKFVTIKLGKTMEGYLKHTFSKQIVVFTIAWMGTRDIYIAFCIATIFIIFADFLFHEDSQYFILPVSMRDYYVKLLEKEQTKEKITEEEIEKAKALLEKAEKQKREEKENKKENENENEIFDTEFEYFSF